MANYEGKQIGIVSLYGLYNYGNRLQSKAVQIMLKKNECLPIVIDCRYPYLQRLKSKIGKTVRRSDSNKSSEAKRKRFLAFESKTQTLHLSIRELRSDLCDAFIVGSDQIWNPSILRPRLAFLQFARRDQRITLSPSFGVEAIPEKMSDIYKTGLDGFESLSIREKAGARIVGSLTGRQAEVLCDPTIAVKPDTWRKLASNESTPKSKYFFAYFLGEVKEDIRQEIFKFAEREQAEIVWLSDKNRAGDIDAGPAEFISLIDHANYVLTDSFHGTVFSILLDTPFTIFRRSEEESTFSRLKSLSDIFSLEACIYSGRGSLGSIRSADRASREQVLLTERSKANKYLEKELTRVFSR